jgi:pimeloyl-ACP methyl ester carboxylesterase
LQALEQQITNSPSAPRITFIAHSLGGMMVLRMLSCPEIRHRHENLLRQVDDAVLFDPADVRVGVELGQLVAIAELSSVMIDFGDALGAVREKVALASLQACYRPGYATRESVDLLFYALTTPEIRKSSQAMIRQAVPGWESKRQPDWVAISRLEENYKNIAVPCLIVWGTCDETLPEWIGHKLAAHIPGAQLVELPECMHSPHLEWPRLCAGLINAFRSGSRAFVATSGTASARPEIH